jgi:hypothetical protein
MDQNDLLARCGRCSLFATIQEMYPHIIREADTGDRDGISEVEFNKILQVKCSSAPTSHTMDACGTLSCNHRRNTISYTALVCAGFWVQARAQQESWRIQPRQRPSGRRAVCLQWGALAEPGRPMRGAASLRRTHAPGWHLPPSRRSHPAGAPQVHPAAQPPRVGPEPQHAVAAAGAAHSQTMRHDGARARRAHGVERGVLPVRAQRPQLRPCTAYRCRRLPSHQQHFTGLAAAGGGRALPVSSRGCAATS